MKKFKLLLHIKVPLIEHEHLQTHSFLLDF